MAAPNKWTSMANATDYINVDIGKDYLWGIKSDKSVHRCKLPCTGMFDAVDGNLNQVTTT